MKYIILFCKLLLAGVLFAFSIRQIDVALIFDFAQFECISFLCLVWFINQVLCAYRLKILLAIVDCRLSSWDVLRVTFLGFAVSSILPGLVTGDVFKVGLIRWRSNVSKIGEISAVVMADRIFGLAALIVMSCALSFQADLDHSGPAEYIVVIVRMLTVLLFLGCAIALFARVLLRRLGVAYANTRLALVINRVARFLRVLTRFLSTPVMMAQAALISTLTVVLLVAGQASVGSVATIQLGDAPKFLIQAFLAPASLVVSSFPISPAGVGVGQITLKSLYSIFELPIAAGVLVATLMQASQIIVAVIVGSICMLSFGRQNVIRR
ncbi:lysylphosphatidylglycerol synthase transmembrane domain-containing protein [Tardiphaga sp.]|jgi:uncharacterized protein (TIRG00374 family)|uniref:lysylphosphatidylglycerol synthase transmembrane domain-containing protein n=1 Tax=Tardiphaga sp. TaxID=1926292 RepID=UPI0037DA12DC